MGRAWKFINRTTGNEIECNDLGFMKHQLNDIRGLNIPETEFINIILRGKTSCTVVDVEGVTYDISVEEIDSLSH